MTEGKGTSPPAVTEMIVTTPAGLEAEARQELARLLPGSIARPQMMKGNVLVLVERPEEEVLNAIAAADTCFLSRVVAVQARVSIAKDTSCFPEIAKAAAAIGRVRAGDLFLVRCNRRGEHAWQSRDLERAVAAELERLTGGVGEYEAEVAWLVSVDVYQDLGFVGVNRPSAVLRKSLRRHRRYAPGHRPLNRAQWKLREALSAFGIVLAPGTRALDLGAAPGGWTAVLAETAAEVIAVDAADLDPAVAALPNVRHIRCCAEELVGRGDLGGPFDLLTCDMNRAPAESAHAMCGLARLVKPGAPAIMTVKYVTRQRRRHEQEARRALLQEYEEIRMKRLPHNAYETTAAMRRKVGQ